MGTRTHVPPKNGWPDFIFRHLFDRELVSYNAIPRYPGQHSATSSILIGYLSPTLLYDRENQHVFFHINLYIKVHGEAGMW